MYCFSLKMTSFLVLFFILSCSNQGEKTDRSNTAYFVGIKKCISCHQKEFRLFRGSDHDRAMAVASAKTVLGNFNNTTFSYFGTTSKFYKKGDKFFVYTKGKDGVLQEFEIKYTFGVYPLQQYLVEFPGGRIQCLPIVWDSRPKKDGGQHWFHLYPNEQIKANDILYWTRISQNWNYTCAECHSTNLKKNYNQETNTYHTTWFEINVSCEACHGPGSEHVRWAKSHKDSIFYEGTYNGFTLRLQNPGDALWRINQQTGNATYTGTPRSSAVIDMCGRCHSHRYPITKNYAYGIPLSETHMVSLLNENLYFPDGQIKEEVYVYGSFLQSKMYQSGVICADCHDSHSGKVRAQGNALCYQCHLSAKYDNKTHHFHKSTSARCIDCHMPERIYMVNDVRRDHSFRIPRPDLSEQLGTPNACNQCHKNKPVKWTASHYKKWYPGRSATRPFGVTFATAQKANPGALEDLIHLIEDSGKPAIIRATAVSLLNNYPPKLYQNFLPVLLSNPKILVRRAALEILTNQPAKMRLHLARPLLNDSSRSVRIMAAQVLSDFNADSLGNSFNELKESQMVNADHPSALVSLSNMYINQQNYKMAESMLQDARSIEPLYIPAWINLADLYRLLGQDIKGKDILLQALKIAPDNAALHYTLGLTYIRLNEKEQAYHHLQFAAKAEPENRIYNYTHAVMLGSGGNYSRAISILERLLLLYPFDHNLLQALITYNNEDGNIKQAEKYTKRLTTLNNSYNGIK